VLARLIQQLGREEPPSGSIAILLRGVERASTAVRNARAYRSVSASDEGLDAASVRAEMESQALLLLDELLGQQEAGA
jgi:hypothetical protein